MLVGRLNYISMLNQHLVDFAMNFLPFLAGDACRFPAGSELQTVGSIVGQGLFIKTASLAREPLPSIDALVNHQMPKNLGIDR